MNNLYQFNKQVARIEFHGLFIATDEEIQSLFNTEIKLRGLPAFTIFNNNVIFMTNEEDFVEEFQNLFGNSFGVNPLDFLIGE